MLSLKKSTGTTLPFYLLPIYTPLQGRQILGWAKAIPDGISHTKKTSVNMMAMTELVTFTNTLVQMGMAWDNQL
jgi:hypothetical protein